MKLIDRYVMEVGRRLPLLRGRKDLENELRSTLEDMLEDRARKAGRPADEAMELDLLREYGAPDQVASTYNPVPYLIGPRMFPMYLMVLKIVLSVVVTVLLVLTGIQIATRAALSGPEFASAVLNGLSGIFSALLSGFGSITLVFAILERVSPAPDFALDEDKTWDPASLKKEPDPQDVKMAEPIAAIVFTCIALSIFNFNPQWIGIYYFSDGQWNVLPVLSQAFFRWLPFINIVWVAEIVMNAILLRAGRWELSTRLLAIAIKIMQIAIGIFLLAGPSILAFSPESLQTAGVFDPEAARILGTMAQTGVRILIAFITLMTGVEMVKHILRLFQPRVLAAA